MRIMRRAHNKARHKNVPPIITASTDSSFDKSYRVSKRINPPLNGIAPKIHIRTVKILINLFISG